MTEHHPTGDRDRARHGTSGEGRGRVPAGLWFGVLALGVLLGVLIAWLATSAGSTVGPATSDVVESAPEAALPTDGTYQTAWSEHDVELRYHYLSNGIPREDLAGLVVFFDGDGTRSFESPDEGRAVELAEAAAAQGRAFAFIDAPVGTSWTSGDTDENAEAVRALVDELAQGRSVLLMGYSGGAEFLAGSVVRRGSDWLPEGSALVLVGGGGTYSEPVAPPGDPEPRLTWVVGDEDGYGATEPEDWSALEASEVAVDAYREAGYAGAERVVVEGDHTDYDFGELVATYADASGG